MDLPLKQGPKGEVKSEGEEGGMAAKSPSSEEQTSPLDAEPSTHSVVGKVHSPKHCFYYINSLVQDYDYYL